MPITASRNAPARNSGTRKMRILADSVSISARPAPPTASFRTSAGAASLKLFAYSSIGLAIFFPWGIAQVHEPVSMLLAAPVLLAKLAVGGALLALIETLSAKMRIFRVPEFLAGAFLLAVIGILVHFLLGA